MLNCHTKNEFKDKAFLEDFCVKQLSILIDVEHFGAAGFLLHPCWCSTPPISQKVTKSPPIIVPYKTNFYILSMKALLHPIITWRGRLKSKKLKMVIKILDKKISQFLWGIFIKFSSCDVHFLKNLQFMTMKILYHFYCFLTTCKKLTS